MRFSNSVLIRRSPPEVFAFLADPANTPRWNYAVTSAQQVTPGPFGVGTWIRHTRSVPGHGVDELEITEFVPNHRLALRGAVGPLTGTLVYVLEDVEGGTRLTNIAELSGRGPLRPLATLATARVRDAVAANLQELVGVLERSG